MIPKSARRGIKVLLRMPNKIKLFYRQVSRNMLTKEDLISKLKVIGVKNGSTLFVHSSLSSLGFIEGGEKMVLEALLDAIGPKGTLVMPTFGWYPADNRDYISEDPPVFNCNITTSKLGAISEYFRNKKNVWRSCHPTHSVSAYGPNARYLVKDHHKSLTPFDSHSPYYKLLGLNADILCLGVSIQYITFYHVFEDMKGASYPIKVYYDQPIKVGVIDHDGAYRIITTYCHLADIAKRRIDHNKTVLKKVTNNFKRQNILHELKIGSSKSYLLNTKQLIEGLSRMLKDGETIYETL